MRRTRLVPVVVLSLALIAAACGGDSSEAANTGGADTTEAAPETTGDSGETAPADPDSPAKP